MKFIDLYAGIGGFRYALESFGYKCVFSAEIDKDAIRTYMANFPDNNPSFDMDIFSEASNEEIHNIVPDHDILTAGFPCQPFSVGGKKEGFKDTRGTQFFNVLRVIEAKSPRFILLENVKNITTHDNGETYRVIRDELTKLGYSIQEQPFILSPTHFGIPQRRERAFFFAERNKKQIILTAPKEQDTNIKDVLEKEGVDYKYMISAEREKALFAWDEFMQNVNNGSKKIPDFWVKDIMEGKMANEDDPEWKKKYYERMYVFYKNNKKFIDKWYKKWGVKDFKKIESKFEWRAGKEEQKIEGKVLMFRTSGVRVMASTKFPTLVARGQMPVIKTLEGKYRYITPKEAARLQSFPDKHIIPVPDPAAYKQFGNSVNIEVVKFIIKNMIKNKK